MENNKQYITKQITGIINLNLFFESIKDLNIKDEDFDYYLDEQHPNPLDNIYFIQYFITK
jgi:hypothetical protein|tara:strand:- start:325 stop:504 length:180 start_codon:yes stop_codon:yes gene_type:complete